MQYICTHCIFYYSTVGWFDWFSYVCIHLWPIPFIEQHSDVNLWHITLMLHFSDSILCPMHVSLHFSCYILCPICPLPHFSLQDRMWAIHVNTSTDDLPDGLAVYPCPAGYCRCFLLSEEDGPCTQIFTSNDDLDSQCSCHRSGRGSELSFHICYLELAYELTYIDVTMFSRNSS